MKRFVYDQIIDRENICNMESESESILNLILKKRNVVVYAPRNYGKTSLIRNIVIPEFKKKRKGSFVYFVDLFDIKDVSNLNQIIQKNFEISFAESFPAKTLINKTKEFLLNFKPQFSVDPLTSQASISLSPNGPEKKQLDISEIFKLINNINKLHPSLIILDEFQAISRIDKLDATFRTNFQLLSDVPIIIMGSQKHMLLDIFSNPSAPLASFGTDVEFPPIDYDKYHDYIQERFDHHHIKISHSITKYIQDKMNRGPESINIVSDNLLIYSCENNITEINDSELVNMIISNLVSNKKSRYENLLYSLSKNEENVLISIAKFNGIDKPNSKRFMDSVIVSPRSIPKILHKLLSHGFLELNQGTYYISDPLLNIYLSAYR